MCIANLKLSLTLTSTSSKITGLSLFIFTFTISLSFTLSRLASSGVIWICLFATITPSSNCKYLSPTPIKIPGVPLISPLSRITPFTPISLQSVNDNSTWVKSLQGPKITTFENSPLGPITLTLSLAAYWFGWDKSFTFVNSYPFPNKNSRCFLDKWTCLPDASTINELSFFSETDCSLEFSIISFNFSLIIFSNSALSIFCSCSYL